MNPILVLNGTETASSALEMILDGVTSVMKLSGDMLTYMVSNPVYVFLIASGFVGIGLSIFAKIRRTASKG